jgi:hypothetical protein
LNNCKINILLTKSIYRKEIQEQELNAKVKEYEYSKKGYFSSVSGWLGYGQSKEDEEINKR